MFWLEDMHFSLTTLCKSRSFAVRIGGIVMTKTAARRSKVLELCDNPAFRAEIYKELQHERRFGLFHAEKIIAAVLASTCGHVEPELHCWPIIAHAITLGEIAGRPPDDWTAVMDPNAYRPQQRGSALLRLY